MVRLCSGVIVLFVIVDITSAIVNNTQIEARNALQDRKTRRKAKDSESKHRSTSSSKTAAEDKDESGTSLELTSISTSDSNPTDIKQQNESTAERKGWRKWHRKCTPCPEDMKKKWRDPRIAWICGAYQRARRSFKSICMMYYRNCQDGTMFVKIHEHRCANSSKIFNHGDHFFYDYNVILSIDSSQSGSSADTADSVDSTS